MIDFNTVTNYFVLVVIVACLVLGYIIKSSLSFIPDKYIPTILAIFGAVLNVVVSGIGVETIVYGAVMGLSSTGMHQAFKQFIENKKIEE